MDYFRNFTNFSEGGVAVTISFKILALTRVFGRFDIVYRGRAGDIVYRGQSKVIKKSDHFPQK